jgi:hypothetical protein
MYDDVMYDAWRMRGDCARRDARDLVVESRSLMATAQLILEAVAATRKDLVTGVPARAFGGRRRSREPACGGPVAARPQAVHPAGRRAIRPPGGGPAHLALK